MRVPEQPLPELDTAKSKIVRDPTARPRAFSSVLRRWLAPKVAVLLALLFAWAPLSLLLLEAVKGQGRFPSADHRLWALSANTILVAGGATFVATALGLPSALLLSRFDLPLKIMLRALQSLPLVVPPFICAIGWLHLLGDTSPLNRALQALLRPLNMVFEPYSLAGPIWVLGLGSYPLVSLLVGSALDQINPEVEECARLDGNWMRRLFAVTLPLVAPALARGMLLAFLLAVSDFAVPSFFAVNVYTVEVFVRFGAFYDYRSGVFTALPLLVLAFAVFALQYALANRWPTATDSAPHIQRRLINPKRWRWVLSLACGGPVVLAVAVPLGALVSRAPELQDYVLAWNIAGNDIANSLVLATLAASLSIAAGFLFAWLVVRSGAGFWASAPEMFLLASLAVPGLILGIGMIRLWNRGFPFVLVYQSLWIVVLAMIARAIPFATVAIASAWRNLTPAYEEVARIEGATSLQTVTRVLAPLLKSGIAAGWSLAFVIAITELQATLLVYPPGYSTLPVRIYTLQHDGQPENVAALCVILVIITLLPVMLVWSLAMREKEI